ncbi:hypothetical protein DM860_010305 [Cuscuta australis]|uniref:Uncharacterized protein n=1 Tax=Cuscuta australis TaxID=267555 RepID=A0A328DB31_9ASTE|nr:hypothetical protein DM860_010305 [Cuscuta australis]
MELIEKMLSRLVLGRSDYTTKGDYQLSHSFGSFRAHAGIVPKVKYPRALKRIPTNVDVRVSLYQAKIPDTKTSMIR